MRRRPALLAGALATLAGCSGREAPEPRPTSTEVPAALRTAAPRAASTPAAGATEQPGTPMAEREAVLGLLNKRNNLSEDITLKPGEARRVGEVIVRLQSCERTAPWEIPPETGAFVQVMVQERGAPGSFRKIFSGWLFKNAPGLNVVEHPVYDVWVKDCAMSFPGEEPAANRDTASGSDEEGEPAEADSRAT